MSLFDVDAEFHDQQPILKPPFGWPGGKSKSVEQILPYLPHSSTYVEVFGGSAAVLLRKPPTRLDVYNDRYAGVTAFYHCMRNPKLVNELIKWLDTTVHSREEWLACKDTWQDCEDPVERAARWYYMTTYSFGAMGRHFGSDKKAPNSVSGKIKGNLEKFTAIHSRFRRVLVENMDGVDCIRKFDSPDTVFYLDPPYVDTASGAYKHEFGIAQHRELIDVIFSSEGYFAVSGYTNPLYEDQKWDHRVEWETRGSLDACSTTDATRAMTTEILWIKEAN